MNEIEISAKIQTQNVVAALKEIERRAKSVSDALTDSGKNAGKKLEDNGREVQTYLGKLTEYGRRCADQIRGAFAALNTMDGLKNLGKPIAVGLKQAASQAFTLNDSLQKIGRTLGLTADKFADFQSEMTQGLGRIGVGADAGARALDGLSETQVRGAGALLEYSKAASMLASIGRENGQEGAIARALAGVTQARGGDVNDKGAMEHTALKAMDVFNATGKSPLKALEEMQGIFSGMKSDTRGKYGVGTVAGVQGAAAVAGPQVMSLFKEYVNMTGLGKLPARAQGMGKLFNEGGVDTDYAKKWMKQIMGRIDFSKEDAAKTLGISDEAAEGFVRLAQSLEKVEAVQRKVASASGGLEAQYRDNMSASEAFGASVNRTTAKIAEPLAHVTDIATKVLKKGASTDAGAAATTGLAVLGGAALSTGAFTGLLKKIGIGGGTASLAKGLSTGAALNKTLGIQEVYVVNMPTNFGGPGAPGGAPGTPGAPGAGGKLGTAANVIGGAIAVAGAATAGYTFGKEVIEPMLNEALPKNKSVQYEGREVDNLTSLEAAAGELIKIFDKITRALDKDFGPIARVFKFLASGGSRIDSDTSRGAGN